MHNKPIIVNPAGGKCGKGVWIWQVLKIVDQIPQCGETNINLKYQKRDSLGQNNKILLHTDKKHWKSEFDLSLFNKKKWVSFRMETYFTEFHNQIRESNVHMKFFVYFENAFYLNKKQKTFLKQTISD